MSEKNLVPLPHDTPVGTIADILTDSGVDRVVVGDRLWQEVLADAVSGKIELMGRIVRLAVPLDTPIGTFIEYGVFYEMTMVVGSQSWNEMVERDGVVYGRIKTKFTDLDAAWAMFQKKALADGRGLQRQSTMTNDDKRLMVLLVDTVKFARQTA